MKTCWGFVYPRSRANRQQMSACHRQRQGEQCKSHDARPSRLGHRLRAACSAPRGKQSLKREAIQSGPCIPEQPYPRHSPRGWHADTRHRTRARRPIQQARRRRGILSPRHRDPTLLGSRCRTIYETLSVATPKISERGNTQWHAPCSKDLIPCRATRRSTCKRLSCGDRDNLCSSRAV